MNYTKIYVFTLIIKREAGQDIYNIFTSYVSARLEMHKQAQKDDVVTAEIYEETIGPSGRTTIGLVDYENGKNFQY